MIAGKYQSFRREDFEFQDSSEIFSGTWRVMGSECHGGLMLRRRKRRCHVLVTLDSLVVEMPLDADYLGRTWQLGLSATMVACMLHVG